MSEGTGRKSSLKKNKMTVPVVVEEQQPTEDAPPVPLAGLYPEASSPHSERETTNPIAMAQFGQMVSGTLQQQGFTPPNFAMPDPRFNIPPFLPPTPMPFGILGTPQVDPNQMTMNQGMSQQQYNTMYNCYVKLITQVLAKSMPNSRTPPPIELNKNDTLYMALPATASSGTIKRFMNATLSQNFGCMQGQNNPVENPPVCTPRCKKPIWRVRRRPPKCNPNIISTTIPPHINVCPCPNRTPSETPQEPPPSPPPPEEPEEPDGPPSPLRSFFGKPDKHGRHQTNMLSRHIMGNSKELLTLSTGTKTPNVDTFSTETTPEPGSLENETENYHCGLITEDTESKSGTKRKGKKNTKINSNGKENTKGCQITSYFVSVEKKSADGRTVTKYTKVEFPEGKANDPKFAKNQSNMPNIKSWTSLKDKLSPEENTSITEKDEEASNNKPTHSHSRRKKPPVNSNII